MCLNVCKSIRLHNSVAVVTYSCVFLFVWTLLYRDALGSLDWLSPTNMVTVSSSIELFLIDVDEDGIEWRQDDETNQNVLPLGICV